MMQTEDRFNKCLKVDVTVRLYSEVSFLLTNTDSETLTQQCFFCFVFYRISCKFALFFLFAAVGLAPYHYPLNAQPGWKANSVGYHADDGRWGLVYFTKVGI